MSESTEKLTTGDVYTGNQSFKGIGIMKWCAVCGKHREQLGGGLRQVMGMRMWVCKTHKAK